jgi:hypothetical protein
MPAECSPPVPVSARSLVGRSVRWQGIRLGTVSEVLFDTGGARAVGLEIACEDERQRFLALTACHIGESIEPASPLVLLEAGALDYYRERCLSLESVLARRGESDDVLLCPDGSAFADRTSCNGAPEGTLAAAPKTPS